MRLLTLFRNVPATIAVLGALCVGGSLIADQSTAQTTQPDAGLTPPPGATPAMVALGNRIYHGQVGGATCAGCHGANAKGSPLGPDLTDKKWLWSDGSDAGIAKTITQGVAKPKEYPSPMPPMGGVQLTTAQVSALAAYIWALSHH